MALAILFMAWYANSSKRDKILCTFRRINKTKINKFVKMNSRYVIFDNGKYDIISSRITFLWYNGGFIHMIFPQWVATLDFSHTSRFPHDPNNMNKNWETPEVRNAINKSELVTSYFKTSTPNSTKKQGKLTEYLPWIAIMAVVLVGFYLYNNMQILNNQLAYLQNAINAINK